MANNIKWPFGKIDVATLTATGAQAITIKGQATIIDGVTVEATGNRTINLTINDNVESGAIILFQAKANGTETETFGTGITAPVMTGVAGKTHTQLFMYNGTAFVATGADQQID
jgi:hypothetical protein